MSTSFRDVLSMSLKKFLYKRAVRVCEHVNTIVVSLASVLFTVCFRITALEEAKHN